MAKDLKEIFPKYTPTPREVQFALQMSTLRAQYSLAGAGIGALTGALVVVSAMKNRSRYVKTIFSTMMTGCGYIAFTAWGELKTIDKWITFEKDASFDSWNCTYTIHSAQNKRHFSFMAEGFRNEIIISEAEAMITLQDKGHTSCNTLLGDLLRPLVLHPNELQMVYEVRYENKTPEEVVDSKGGEALSEEEFHGIVDSLRILAESDDDDPSNQQNDM